MLLFSSVLGRALTHHDSSISVRYVFTRPKKVEVCQTPQPCLQKRPRLQRGAAVASEGECPLGRAVSLTVTSRVRTGFQNLPGQSDGLGPTSHGKAVAWKLGEDSLGGIWCTVRRARPIAPLAVVWGSVSSTYHRCVELWSGFLATEK